MWNYLTSGLTGLGTGIMDMGSDIWGYMTGGTAGSGTSVNPVWGSSLTGDISNVLGSKQGLQGLQTGISGINAYNQYQFNKDMQDVMNRQLQMQEEAYKQDQQAYEDRQNLRF